MSSASSWQLFKYGKLGEVTENIRTFALPYDNQSYTFKMKYRYDSYNRIRTMTYPDGEVVSYGYNLGGLLESVTGDKNGVAYRYIDSISYNAFELRDSVAYGNGSRVRYEYDSIQRLSRLQSVSAGEVMQDVSYTFDAAGNITRLQNTAAMLGSGLGGSYECDYTYDNNYRLTGADGGWDGADQLEYNVEMDYHKNGRVHGKAVEIVDLGAGTTISQYTNSYHYLPNSNKLTGIDNGSTQFFEWDAKGNMTFHKNSAIPMRRFLCWDEQNRLHGVVDEGHLSFYQYDANGDRTFKQTGKGELQNINGSWQYFYVLENPTLYASPYVVATDKGYTKHYYAESERVASRIGGGGLKDIMRPVRQHQAVSRKVEANSEMTGRVFSDCLGARHYKAQRVLNTLYEWRDLLKPEDDGYWYHPDHQGSSSWVTDTGGHPVQHLHYLPWGEDFVNQKSSGFDGVRYTFSAKEKDTETGYSYFGARYYNSDLSIWLSVDPMSDKYPSLSPYTYCANNPVKLVDPNGDTIRFDTEADRTFVLPLLNKNGNSYSPEFEAIYNKLNESDHTYTFSLTHDNGKEEGHFENKDAHCSIIHYSINTYNEHYGASKYRNLFEETYHAYQYDRKRKVINSCFSEAMAWKFSSLAPGTTYVNAILGYTVMKRCRDLPAWQLALELKFGMLPNDSYCGTESKWGEGRYHEFPLAVPEERIFFPLPVLFLTK